MNIRTAKIVFIVLLGLTLLLLGPGQHLTAVANDSSSDLSLGVGIKKSSGKSNASLNGTFIMGVFGTESSPWTAGIKLTFYGNGNGAFQVLDDSSGDPDSGSFTYSVASDGKISVPGAGLVGAVNAAENMFTLVDTNAADGDLSLNIGVKQPAGMSNASLNGTFILGEYGTTQNPWAARLKLTFYGNGNGTFQVLHDSAGYTAAGSFTYSIASDGIISIPGQGLVGVVHADGNMFVLLDTNATDGDLSIKIGVKQPAGMSNASLKGTFMFVEYGTDPSPRSGRLELTFDGQGNGTFVELDDSSGQTGSGTFSYSVTSEGKLSIPGQGVIGVVNADGNMFVLVDSNEPICVAPFLQLLLNGG